MSLVENSKIRCKRLAATILCKTSQVYMQRVFLLVFSLHLWYCFAKAESAEEITPLDFRCLWEKRAFLPKTLGVFWKNSLFYQRRQVSFGKTAFFTKDVRRLLEKRQFLPKTLGVFWKNSLFYQRR